MTEKLYIVKKSGIHETGLFAKTDIPKHARIIEYTGEKITKREADRRTEELERTAKTKGLGHVYIFTLNKRYDLDGNVKTNLARFINHSCHPNCEAEISRGKVWISAIRNIKEGEELSYDYGYDIENFMEHPCYCGTKKCVGYIVRSSQRARVKRFLASKNVQL